MSARRATLVVLLLLVLAGCGRYGPPQPLTRPPAAAQQSPDPAAAAEDATDAETPGSQAP